MAGVLITRPYPEAERTAAAVSALGHTPLIDPMLTVRPVAGPPLDLRSVQALLATSVNGVRSIAARTGRRDLPLFAVGTRTAEAARQAGFAAVEDAGGNAADLAALIALAIDPAKGRLLHVSGREVAVDLAALLGPRGYRVTRIVGYEAVPAGALAPETLAALRAGGMAYVLFFSPRTARTFVSLLERDPGADGWLARVEALCLSPAVTKAVAGPDWKAVRSAGKPDAGALLALLPPAKD